MKQSAMPALRKSSGAFDLPSITTGVIVVGILIAGVLTAIFGVIPFSQDRGARQDLASIRTAEGVSRAKDNRFLSHEGLLDVGYLHESSMERTRVLSDEKGTCYVAVAKSGTGKLFYTTDKTADPRELTADIDPGCLPAKDVEDLIEEVGGIEEPAANPTATTAPTTPSTASPEPTTPDEPAGTPEATVPPAPDATPEATTPAAPGTEPPTASPAPTANPSKPAVEEPAVTAPTNLKLSAVSPLQAKATWSGVKGANGYKVEYQINEEPWITQAEKQGSTAAYISALPEQTVTVKVTTLFANESSDPVTATLQLPDTTLKNPSFELGAEGWALNNTTVQSDRAHSGTKSLRSTYSSNWASQTVDIPADAPVLTYWATGLGYVTANGSYQPSTGQVTEDGWTQFNVDLSRYAGTTIQLRLSSHTNSITYIDDVALEAAKVPDAPTTVKASSRNGGATVTWKNPVFTGGTPITSYTATAYLNGEAQTSVTVAADRLTATIPDLTLGSSYTFTMTANSTVGASEESAETAAVRILDSALANPGFELGQEGWTLSGSYTAVSSDRAHSGTKSLLSSRSSYWASQTVDIPADAPVLTYWATGLGYVTVNGNYEPSTRQVTEDGWTQFNVDLSRYAGTTIQLRLAAHDNSVTYIDDVALEAAKVPDAPTAAAASSRSGGATVTWKNPAFSGGTPITSYTATAYLDGESKASAEVASTLRTATIPGLNTGSDYTFTVTANNAVGASAPAETGTVQILDGALANPGFELGTEGWTLSVTAVSSDRAHSGTKSLLSSRSSYWASQTVDIPADAPVLTYWATGLGYVTVNGSYQLSTGQVTEDGWYQFSVDLSRYAGTTIQLRLASHNNSVTYIDDVAFEAAKVPDAPTAAAASSRSGGATVTWKNPAFSGGTPITSYTATAYLDGESKASAEVASTLRTATIPGLNTGSDYTFTVTANNAVGASAPAETGTVQILDGALANPGFELGTEGWTLGSASSSVSSSKARTGSNSLSVSNASYAYGASQDLAVPADKPVLTYWSTGVPTVYANTTAQVSTKNTTEDGWTQYRTDFSAYAGKTLTLRIAGPATTYIDDLAFEAAMVPDVPTAPAASSRSGGATVTWKNPAFSGGTPITSYTATAYLNGEAQASTEVASTLRTATIPDLNTGSDYTFTVTANNTVGASAPAETGTVQILDGALANPGFELGTEGWTLGSASSSVSSAKARTGSRSLSVSYASYAYGASQDLAVPADKPVLTYWSTGVPTVYANTTAQVSTKNTTEDGWTQYRTDFSAYAGKTLTLRIAGPATTYIDDLAFEAAMVPDVPTAPAASSRSGGATVTWKNPAFSGGTPITSYTATAYLNGEAQASTEVAATLRTATIPDLNTGSDYTFTVTANNTVGASAPAETGTVQILDGALANPGFELGTEGWTMESASSSVSSAKARTGSNSLSVSYASYAYGASQTLAVPADKPVLTYWSTGVPTVYANATARVSTKNTTEDGWTQYRTDFSAYAGKTLTLRIAGPATTYIDDVAFEAK